MPVEQAGCDTCGHTLAVVHNEYPVRIAHCERCGTLVITGNNVFRTVYVPKLVERCRAFAKQYGQTLPIVVQMGWHSLGIGESIDRPEERKFT
jgi:hypothetical protein